MEEAAVLESSDLNVIFETTSILTRIDLKCRLTVTSTDPLHIIASSYLQEQPIAPVPATETQETEQEEEYAVLLFRGNHDVSVSITCQVLTV
jgi:hypothetical protein